MSSTPSPTTPQTEFAALVSQLQIIAQAGAAAQAHLNSLLIAPHIQLTALVAQLQIIAKAGAAAQAHLTNILLVGSFVPVPSFVAGTPATPEELAAANNPEITVESYWVVLRGRKPGLYLSVRAANDQTLGVPGQFQQRKNGRDEALAFYAANYPDHVRKWVPIPAPVPVPVDVPSTYAAPATFADDSPA
ncbi:hypothetical protein DFH09DRAFT_1329405 [Mycena vulgaris]|nr:hypothetical protein DFH09DRAFT_1329405 [Mycena vulgaris]